MKQSLFIAAAVMLFFISFAFIAAPTKQCSNITLGYTEVGQTAGCRFVRITIDGCDYIYGLSHGDGRFMTHAGNCKNPIHRK